MANASFALTYCGKCRRIAEPVSKSSGGKYVDWLYDIVGGTIRGGKDMCDLESENRTKLEVKGSELFPHNPASATNDWAWNGILWHDRRRKVYDRLITMGFWGAPFSGYAYLEYRFFDFSYASIVEFVEAHCNSMRCAPERGWSQIRRFVLQHEVSEEVLKIRYRLPSRSD